MKKIIKTIFLCFAFLTVFTFLVACGKNDGKDTDYGTLTIEDIRVAVDEEKDIVPVFSNESNRTDVTYEFKGNNIEINNGKVKGLTHNTRTIVTAKTAHHQATFTVLVKNYDRGSLVVHNVSVEVNGTAELKPTFTTEDGKASVTYSFEGENIKIENGIVTGLVVNTKTVVKATTIYHTEGVSFTVEVTPPDYGKLNIVAPTIYANYTGKPLKVSFTKEQYASDITYTVTNFAFKDRITIEDGIVTAKGVFTEKSTVAIKATTQYHETTFNVTVDFFQGANAQGASLGLEASVNRLLTEVKNKGITDGKVLFVGDSFFDTRWFWTDFYTTFAKKEAYTVGISATTTTDWELLSERLVYPLNPSAIVLHCGTNNIFDDRKNAQQATEDIKRLFSLFEENCKDVPIYYFAIEPRVGQNNKPSEDCNKLVKQYCDTKENITYIDSAAFCYTDGAINNAFYKSGDTIHPALESYDLYINELVKLGVLQENPGTLTITVPTIYANYTGKSLKANFSKKSSESPITYEIPNEYKDILTIENDIVTAKGNITANKTITIKAKSEKIETNFTVNVELFQGATGNGSSLNLEASVNRLLNDWQAKGSHQNSVLFVGDSFFDTRYFWTNFYDTFEDQNAFTVGISATTTTDWELLSERLVYPLNPKAIVLHCGTNNIFDDRKNAQQATDDIKRLFTLFQENCENIPVYYFAIEPRKGQNNATAIACNTNIKAYCETQDNITYIDSAAFCYKTDGSIDDTFYRDTVHPTLESYQLYVDALQTCGVTYDATLPDLTAKIPDIVRTTADKVTNSSEIIYGGKPLKSEYVLTGKIDITEILNNAHLQFKIKDDGNRFLLWDGDSNKKLGLGYSVNGKYTKETGFEKYTFESGKTLSIGFKLVTTSINSYFFFENSDGTYTLEATFIKAPLTNNLMIGCETMAMKVYNLKAINKKYNLEAYNREINAEEITYYENFALTGLTEGLYIALPSASTSSVVRHTANYISTADTFILKGVNNGDANYTGPSRDWRFATANGDQIAGNFTLNYDFEILDTNLQSITAISETSISAKNWFHVISVSVDQTLNTWSDYHLLYWKDTATTTKVKTLGDSSAVNQTGLTATQFHVNVTRVDSEVKLNMTVAGTTYTSTCTINASQALTLFLSSEQVNGKITNFTFTQN